MSRRKSPVSSLVRPISVILKQAGKGGNNIALFAALKAGRYKESRIADFSCNGSFRRGIDSGSVGVFRFYGFLHGKLLSGLRANLARSGEFDEMLAF